jgi:uncharacterized protein YkwD
MKLLTSLALLAALGTYYGGKNDGLNWTSDQLAKANTFALIDSLSEVEKDAMKYINLCRLYPADFVRIELTDEKTKGMAAGNILSLKNKLKTLPSLPAIQYDPAMQRDAICFAEEQYQTGKIGHQRRRCESIYLAECISYGMSDGRSIAMQLFVDEGVPDLGHRKILLTKSYTKGGISFREHPKNGFCAVLDLR